MKYYKITVKRNKYAKDVYYRKDKTIAEQFYIMNKDLFKNAIVTIEEEEGQL